MVCFLDVEVLSFKVGLIDIEFLNVSRELFFGLEVELVAWLWFYFVIVGVFILARFLLFWGSFWRVFGFSLYVGFFFFLMCYLGVFRFVTVSMFLSSLVLSRF